MALFFLAMSWNKKNHQPVYDEPKILDEKMKHPFIKSLFLITAVEFGSKSADRETILHTATNLVCSDAYLIDGQSNGIAMLIFCNVPFASK